MQRRRYSVAEIRSRAQRRTSNLYDTYFTRVVSAWITALVAPLGISPNTVSVLNFFVGVGGCALIGLGSTTGQVVAGIVLIHLYAVLDSVDGELARLLNRGSLKGMFLEDWSAYGVMAAFPVGVGLYVQNAGGSGYGLAFAVLFAVLGRNAMPAVRRAIGESRAYPPAEGVGTTSPSARVSGWKALLENHVLHLTNVRLVLTSLIVAHLLTGIVGLVEVPLLFYLGAMFAREAAIVTFAMRADLIERELRRLRGADRSAATDRSP
jgi:phosphatidylglycerophosphate synthase